MVRTFHPIGQGAFYSERHFFPNSEFTIVYDCGSTSVPSKKLESKIRSSFPKNHQIDILFISHFHADHINGIETLTKHCKIKKVVIPLIDNETKILLINANLLESNFSDTRLIDNPSDLFGSDIPIIRIDPATDTDETNLNATQLISDIDTSKTLPSGTVLIPREQAKWYFIPVNFEHNRRKEQFRNALKRYRLELTDIDTIYKINTHKGVIKNAYAEVDGDLNTNSMVLYSGYSTNETITCTSYPFFFRTRQNSGCLYTGDIDLTENNLETKFKRFFRPKDTPIGTLQIPHHGSIHNSKNPFYNKE